MKMHQSGRSMIEMLGVLAIIGVLSAAGLYGYQKAMAKHKMNKTISQMTTIVNNIHMAFSNLQASKTPYKDLNQTRALLLNIFPEEMVNRSTNKVINLYKGEVTVGKPEGDDSGETFEVVFEGLPKEVSIAIGTIDWGTSDVSGLQEVEINDGEEEEESQE